MKVETMSKYNNAKEYRNNEINSSFRSDKTPTRSLFTAKANEHIYNDILPYDGSSLEDVVATLDEIDYAILEELGRSKYLITLQIYQFLRLRGLVEIGYDLAPRMNRLAKYQLIKSQELKMDTKKNGIRYFMLSRGNKIAETRGVIFHKGNCLEKIGNEHVVTPEDVKRVLTGNMIVLGMLMNHVEMERFGIMETVRAQSEVNIAGGAIIRTAAIIQLDSESVLLYEVVRRSKNSFEKLADKVKRYYSLLESDYCADNYHGHATLPQLVICGEDYMHNCMIDKYLREHGLWSEKDSLLYTEDLFYVKATRQVLYELDEDGKQKWYCLSAWDKEIGAA